MHPSVTALITSGRAQLAPMLGTTDIPFRRLCREYGAGLLTTEMVSATGVLAGDSASFKNAAFDASEHPIALQLVAASPSTAAQAVEELLPLRPDAFELNCGCPDDAICAAGAGSALVDDLPRLTAVLAAMVAASPVPVAAKVRALGRAASRSHASAAASVARAVEDAGAAWITVHARARGVDYEECADWSLIAAAVEAVSIPVAGNGDVFSAADARRMLRETGCASVTVGRGCLGAPWIFADIAAGRDCGILDCAPEPGALGTLVDGHLRAMEREFGPIVALPRMRKHLLWYARFFEGAERLRGEVFAAGDAQAIAGAAARFFAAEPQRLDPAGAAFRERDALFRRRVLYWTQQ